MHTYRITCLFQADWSTLYPALFGNAQHCASRTEDNVATFTFDTPQTPANLGPLVKVELLPSE
jgi:hypothetical protein